MEMNDWIMLVTTLGGIVGIKQLVKWWVNRKTDRRISDAQADVKEFKALWEYNEFLQKLLSVNCSLDGKLRRIRLVGNSIVLGNCGSSVLSSSKMVK